MPSPRLHSGRSGHGRRRARPQTRRRGGSCRHLPARRPSRAAGGARGLHGSRRAGGAAGRPRADDWPPPPAADRTGYLRIPGAGTGLDFPFASRARSPYPIARCVAACARPAHEDLAGGRELLEPRGDVHVAGDHQLAPRDGVATCDDLARLDPEADPHGAAGGWRRGRRTRRSARGSRARHGRPAPGRPRAPAAEDREDRVSANFSVVPPNRTTSSSMKV